jgi:hypothetical protein
VDLAVLAVCREHLGEEIAESTFWGLVAAIAGECAPDTPRRRRDALQSQGLVEVERVALGVVRVKAVRS